MSREEFSNDFIFEISEKSSNYIFINNIMLIVIMINILIIIIIN